MSISLDTALLYDTTPVVTEDAKPELPPEALDDRALVTHAQTGDVQAFEELVRRYRNQVFALSFHFVHNREEAWDLSQEVFVKAYRSLRRFRGDASFKTWLMRITANQSKDFLKKRRLRTVSLDDEIGKRLPSGTAGPDEGVAAQELGAAIEQAVRTLPPKHRTVFVLREYEGLSYQEIAEVMQCNVGTVMSRLHHARRKLQSKLIKMGVVEQEDHA